MDSSTMKRFQRAQGRMLLVTMFCYVFFYTGRQTFGFAIPGISEELGISKTQLGWISTALLWSYAIGQSINGNLGDKFGGRRMMSLGAVLSCGLNWIVSFGTNAVSLLIPWAANGFAQSMGWAPGSRVLANWWEPEHRGRVYGLYVFAAGMSSVLAYVTSALILQFDLGWRSIFRIPVLLLLVGGVAYYLVARDRPEDLGLSSLGQPGRGDGLGRREPNGQDDGER
jgi:MFS transporter, OPA family, glycerol-3-phosphate transporter